MRGKKNNNPFLLKQISIHHHLCAHKVGFDGVLLGAWTNFNSSKTILDIGTGSGLIALMAAQKNENALISGIEIDEDSFKQAQLNFKNSTWCTKLTIIQGDFLTHAFSTKFDHIVSNPPYFLNALETPLEKRTNARHNSVDNFEKLIQKTTNLLNPAGLLSIIIPTNNKEQILSILNHANFYLSRICHVYTKSNEISERILLQCSLTKCNVEENNLFVYDSNGNYSTEYIKLTNAFYLNF